MSIDEIISADVSRLAEIEGQLDRLVSSFCVEAGKLLAVVRDEQLYRAAGFSTFEKYVLSRYGFSRGHAYRCIDAADVCHQLETNELPAPPNESIMRELAPLKRSPEKLCETWKRVSEEHGPKATARVTRKAVKEVLGSDGTVSQWAAPHVEENGVAAHDIPPIRSLCRQITRQATKERITAFIATIEPDKRAAVRDDVEKAIARLRMLEAALSDGAPDQKVNPTEDDRTIDRTFNVKVARDESSRTIDRTFNVKVARDESSRTIDRTFNVKVARDEDDRSAGSARTPRRRKRSTTAKADDNVIRNYSIVTVDKDGNRAPLSQRLQR